MNTLEEALLSIRGEVDRAIKLAAVPTGAGDLPTAPILLDVPYSSQHEVDARKFRLDCGPACVEMVGEYYRGQIAGVGTDQIMTWITGGTNTTTSADDLARAAMNFYQVKLTKHYGVTTSELHRWIDDGKPAIVLVRYGDFPLRMDLSYTSAHWMVVVGYDSYMWTDDLIERIVVHDPDWYGAFMAQGAYLPVVEAMFDGMFADYNRLALLAEV